MERMMWVLLLVVSGVAFFWHTPGFDPFVAAKPTMPYAIALTMFCIGGVMPPAEIRELIARWPAVIWGTGVQYLSMPLLAFGVGRLFNLDDDAMIGLVLVGCVPDAMASGVVTLLARGHVSYAVSLTTCSTLLSPITVPLGLALFIGVRSDYHPMEAFQYLIATVLGPVLLGYFLARKFSMIESWMARFGPVLSNLTILIIIGFVVGSNRERLPRYGISVPAALFVVNVLGYAAGYLGGWIMGITPSMRRALTLAVGMQNAGLGTALAAELFANRESVAIPPAIYTFGCMLTGTLLASFWSRYPCDAVTAGGTAPSEDAAATDAGTT